MTTTHRAALQYAFLAVASVMAFSPLAYADETEDSSSGILSHPHQITYLSDDAWVNDIGALLYSDKDQDGYFSGLSLSIDADSNHTWFDVYATIDIVREPSVSSSDGVVERLHTTQVFTVHGRSVSDEYRIDIDLIQNYSSGIYDLQIELVDAHDHQLLDKVGPDDYRNLRALALESEDNQSIHIPVAERPIEPANDDIRVVEYTGGTGPGMVALFVASMLLRRKARHGVGAWLPAVARSSPQ